MSSVNRPTNVKQKEADVNQKLQLYGIYSGMLPFVACSHPAYCYNILRDAMVANTICKGQFWLTIAIFAL